MEAAKRLLGILKQDGKEIPEDLTKRAAPKEDKPEEINEQAEYNKLTSLRNDFKQKEDQHAKRERKLKNTRST